MTLAAYLASTGLTQEQFALLVGTTAATVSRLAAGLQYPRWNMVDEIDRATRGKVTANDFLRSWRAAQRAPVGRGVAGAAGDYGAGLPSFFLGSASTDRPNDGSGDGGCTYPNRVSG